MNSNQSWIMAGLAALVAWVVKGDQADAELEECAADQQRWVGRAYSAAVRLEEATGEDFDDWEDFDD